MAKRYMKKMCYQISSDFKKIIFHNYLIIYVFLISNKKHNLMDSLENPYTF